MIKTTTIIKKSNKNLTLNDEIEKSNPKKKKDLGQVDLSGLTCMGLFIIIVVFEKLRGEYLG